jgi:hypothetical protein
LVPTGIQGPPQVAQLVCFCLPLTPSSPRSAWPGRDRSGRRSARGTRPGRTGASSATAPRGQPAGVWLQRDGSPLGKWGIESIFRRVKARCGVSRFHAHLARHTFGSLALRNGADRQLVQDMMGHKTALMTVRYTKQERAVDAAAQMPKYVPVSGQHSGQPTTLSIVLGDRRIHVRRSVPSLEVPPGGLEPPTVGLKVSRGAPAGCRCVPSNGGLELESVVACRPELPCAVPFRRRLLSGLLSESASHRHVVRTATELGGRDSYLILDSRQRNWNPRPALYEVGGAASAGACGGCSRVPATGLDSACCALRRPVAPV